MPESQHIRFKSAHARYAAYAAELSGYEFISLDGDDGYLFEVRNGSERAVFAAGAGSPYALNDVRAASIARDKWFCAAVLARAGIPVIPGEMFFVTSKWAEMRAPGREPEDALAYARSAKFPLFCKPLSASNGLYAEVVDDADGFAAYMRRVARDHFAMLAQPFIRGTEHRVFVLAGLSLFSYRKKSARVVGDGRRTLAELVAAIPLEPSAPPLKPRARATSGALLDPAQVLAPGEIGMLEGPANRAAGGGAEPVADGAPAPLAKIALAAADAVGLGLAGVDIFDVSPQRDLTDLVVIEVNSNPMIATLEDQARWDLIGDIWRANLVAALA